MGIEKTVIGRINYIDPNDLFTDEDNKYNNIPVEQDDLSMYVNLEVRIPSRNMSVSNDEKNFNSILNGSDINVEGDKTYNFLTDSYVDVSYTEIRNENKINRELFGIKSIDVSFDAQFFPQVIIEFTDIRAFTLMGPIEHKYMMTEGEMGELTARDFFNALFHFPYPVFTLNLKGFYGPGVSFELAVSDFDSKFDSNEGNFNVTVKFIGYMYGFYTDLPSSYVLSSPFFDYNGRSIKVTNDNYKSVIGTYWEQKVNDGTFTFPEYVTDDSGTAITNGDNIPTYIEFLSKYAELLTPNTDKLKELGVEASKTINLNNYKNYLKDIELLNNALGAFKTYKSYIESIGLKGNGHVLLCLTDKELKEITSKSTPECAQLRNIITDLPNNEEFNPIGRALSEFYNERNFVKINENLKFFITRKSNGEYIKVYDVNNIQAYGMSGGTNNNDDEVILFGDNSIKDKVDNFIIKSENPKASFYVWKSDDYSGNDSFYSWNQITGMVALGEKDDKIIRNKIDKIIVSKKDSIAGIKEASETEGRDVAKKILGFLPTLENIYRMLFAHLDTFTHHMYDTIENIKQTDKRKSILSYKNDVPKNRDDVWSNIYVPPFPGVANNNNGKKIYPGEITEFAGEPEIKLVENIYNNIKLFRNVYDEANKAIEVSYNAAPENKGNLPNLNFIPLLYTDFFYGNVNPYEKVIETAHSDDESRAKAIVGLLRERLRTYELLYSVEGLNDKVIAKIEAFNITKGIKKLDYHLLRAINDTLHEYFATPLNEYVFFMRLDSVEDGKEIMKDNGDKTKIVDVRAFEKGNTEINGIYGGKVNNMLCLWPFTGENYNKLKNYWNEEINTYLGKDRSETYFKNYKLESIDVSDTDYGIDDKYKSKKFELSSNNTTADTINDAFRFLKEYDSIIKNKIYYNIAILGGSKGSCTVRTESLLVLLKIGAYLYKEDDKNKVSLNYYHMVEENGAQTRSFDIFNIFKEDMYQSHVDNLKQLFIEWATGNKVYFNEILKDAILFKNLITHDGELRIENINRLAEECVIAFISKESSFKSTSVTRKNVFNSFIDTLREINNYDKKMQDVTGIIQSSDTSLNTSVNNDIKCGIYYTLKNFYDKWLCAKKKEEFQLPKNEGKVKEDKQITSIDKNGDVVKEYNRIEYVDTYLNRLTGDKATIDMSVIKNVFDNTLSMDGSQSLFETMHEIASKNGYLFLTVPIYNENDIKKIFEPYSLYNAKYEIDKCGAKYIILFPGEPSKFLDMGDRGDMENDSFEIANNFEDSPFIENGLQVNAFGVAFGKQNQNYFKSVNIGMENSTPTDYSIANTLNLSKGGSNGDQQTSTFLNNSLYPIFANRSYSCTVEMMGNVAITPLMYFQLNNVPMFRGTYIITDVSHKIVPGDFTTTITGVRIPKFNYKPNNKVLALDELINRCGSGDLGDVSKSEEISTTVKTSSKSDKKTTLRWDNNLIYMGNMSRAIPTSITKDTITVIKDKNNEQIVRFSSYTDSNNESNFNNSQKSLKEFLYRLATMIKETPLMDDVSVLVTSSFREYDRKYTKKTQHNWGFAIDIQGTDRKSNSKNGEKTAKLYNFIALNKDLTNMIDQIIWETHESNGQKKENSMVDLPNVIHISTANNKEVDEMSNSTQYYKTFFNGKQENLPRHMIIQGYITSDSKYKGVKTDQHEFVKKANSVKSGKISPSSFL